MALAFLTLAMAALAWWMAAYIRRAAGSVRNWPTVSGKILERGIGEPMWSTSFSYLPYVKYTYSVADKTYINDQVYLLRRTGGLDWQIRRLVDRLPDPIPVHYDPENPERSYLLPQPAFILVTLVIFGTGAFIIGVAQLLIAAM